MPHSLAFLNGTATSGIAQQDEQGLLHSMQCCCSKVRL